MGRKKASEFGKRRLPDLAPEWNQATSHECDETLTFCGTCMPSTQNESLPAMLENDTSAEVAPGGEASVIAQTTALMRASHKSETSRLQQAMDRIMAIVGWPGSALVLCLSIFGWIAMNLAVAEFGLAPFDPPPFVWLHVVAATAALMLAALIFTTQRREDKLADHRAQLIMELSISNDQKISKIIELLEEGRRDNPAIADRIDDVAAQMSSPSDAEAVLVAIKDLQE